METVLIVALAMFAVIALIVWWMLDIDIADIVASSVTPLLGIVLIYRYGTPLAWAGGLLLFAIGAFSLYHLLRRRSKRS